MQNQPHIMQFHVIRTLPVNNANSGEDGSPKKVPFGGSQRYRLSSQSIKARMRHSSFFRDGEIPMSTRTTALPELVKRELQTLGADETTIEAIVSKMVAGLGKEGKEGGKKKAKDAEPTDESEMQDAGDTEAVNGEPEKKPAFANTKAAFLVSPNEPIDIARHFLEMYATLGHAEFEKAPMGKLTADFRGDGSLSADAALFGRFSTSGVLPRMEAACYVSHAFSVNYAPDMADFYASREESPFGDRSTTMIGDSPFATGTYYHHCALDLLTLVQNLEGNVELARKIASAFVEAILSPETVPSGKQHGMFAATYPDHVTVEAARTSVTYAPAFSTPIRANSDANLAQVAAQALADYIATLDKNFAPAPERKLFSMLPGSDGCSATELAEWVASHVPDISTEAAA
jgi:CRISPR system Cascade subunit CasC